MSADTRLPEPPEVTTARLLRDLLAILKGGKVPPCRFGPLFDRAEANLRSAQAGAGGQCGAPADDTWLGSPDTYQAAFTRLQAEIAAGMVAVED
jgi:hypothetical protein